MLSETRVAPAANPSEYFRSLYDMAHAAGMAAGLGSTPTPMVVTGMRPGAGEPPKAWFVPDGVCGFAWVVVKGTSAFGKWARKEGLARPGYPKGLHFWVGEFNQSLTRKEAYAHAFSKVLRDHGVEAYTGSRMD